MSRVSRVSLLMCQILLLRVLMQISRRRGCPWTGTPGMRHVASRAHTPQRLHTIGTATAGDSAHSASSYHLRFGVGLSRDRSDPLHTCMPAPVPWAEHGRLVRSPLDAVGVGLEGVEAQHLLQRELWQLSLLAAMAPGVVVLLLPPRPHLLMVVTARQVVAGVLVVALLLPPYLPRPATCLASCWQHCPAALAYTGLARLA